MSTFVPVLEVSPESTPVVQGDLQVAPLVALVAPVAQLEESHQGEQQQQETHLDTQGEVPALNAQLLGAFTVLACYLTCIQDHIVHCTDSGGRHEML